MKEPGMEGILAKKEKTSIGQKTLSREYPQLYQDIGKRVSSEGNRTVYENASLTTSINYKDASLDQLETFPQFRQFVELSKQINLEEYFILTEFSMRTKDTEFDLDKENRKVCILFKKNPGPNLVDASAYPNLGAIVLNSGPTTPQGILSYFHERGHMNDLDISEEASKRVEIEYRGNVTGEEKKEIDQMLLKQERFAWAHALATLRPFLKGLGVSREDVDTFVHRFALASHCVGMPEKYES